MATKHDDRLQPAAEREREEVTPDPSHRNPQDVTAQTCAFPPLNVQSSTAGWSAPLGVSSIRWPLQLVFARVYRSGVVRNGANPA